MFFRSRSSFTLIELLVVIAILAVLAAAVILVINPAELLKQSRDSNRLSDMVLINKALNLLIADNQNIFLGTSSIVYISLPDSSPTCGSWSLPALSFGYVYSCVPSSTYTKINGAGWLPANFSQFSTNSILSRLPIDPQNSTSSSLFYSFVTNGTNWTLSTQIESNKYLNTAGNDGGGYTSKYEIGNDLSLLETAGNLIRNGIDWINPTNGLAQNWLFAGYATSYSKSIVTDSDFSGNAQKTTIDIDGASHVVYLYQDVGLTIGKKYHVKGRVKASYRYGIYRGQGNQAIKDIKLLNGQTENFDFTFTATGSAAPQLFLSCFSITNGDYCIWDNISVKEVFS